MGRRQARGRPTAWPRRLFSSGRATRRPPSLRVNSAAYRGSPALPFGVSPGRGLLYELHQGLVRLGADDAVLAGDEGRHARDPVLARELPVRVDSVLERPFLEHLAGGIDGQADLPRDVQKHGGPGNVARLDEVRAEESVVDGLATRLRVRPLPQLLG